MLQTAFCPAVRRRPRSAAAWREAGGNGEPCWVSPTRHARGCVPWVSSSRHAFGSISGCSRFVRELSALWGRSSPPSASLFLLGRSWEGPGACGTRLSPILLSASSPPVRRAEKPGFEVGCGAASSLAVVSRLLLSSGFPLQPLSPIVSVHRGAPVCYAEMETRILGSRSPCLPARLAFRCCLLQSPVGGEFI